MKKTNPEKLKDRVVAFRLSSEEFTLFDEKLQRSTMSKSEFFRSIFLSSHKTFTLKEKTPPDYKKLLFFVSKASNNISHITKQFHRAEQAGLIDSKAYFNAMNDLASINQLLKSTLDVG